MKTTSRRSHQAWPSVVVCLAVLAALVVAPAFRSRAQSGMTYTITDLGPPGGCRKAFGLNNNGQVVGDLSSSLTCDPSAGKHSFFWAGIAPINLEPTATPTPASSSAVAVNNSARAVGNLVYGNGQQQALVWHDDNSNGVSDAGELQPLPFPSGDTFSTAWDVNDNNLIVGQSEDENFVGHAVLWQQINGQWIAQTLQPAGGIQPVVARGINNPGHIVGTDPSNHGFLFNGTTNIGITPSNGPLSFPQAVSDSDDVVGYTQANLVSPTDAFIWTGAGGVKSLGALSGDTSSIAYELATVNGSIQVVGRSIGSGNSRAFVWQDADGDGQGAGDPNEMKELLPLVTNDLSHEWTNLQEARSINNIGQIAGFGTKNGETHAFLLTPVGVPTPTPTPTPTPDVTIGVAPAPALVTESGATDLTFTFTRTGGTGNALTVNFSVGGTATFGNDYTQTGATTFSSSTGSVTIGAGNSSATVTIDPAVDAILEGDETVTLTVTSGTGYNVANPSAATGTITPDAPVLFTEINTSNAVAVDSVTFARGPFQLTDTHNFSGDHLTRVILITSDLGMAQQDLSKNFLSVRIAGYGNPLPIENVGTLTIAATPAFNVSYVVVRLPADLPNPMPGPNNLTLTVKMGSAESNATILSITP